uniref:Uncharacterized protein n=1 Tax=Picea sitchensis TaxID=3332 RepID=A0A6B9XPK5_PICSI|nr:hypothetical protein Q903MT_gene3902 [Picea sitchensis]
MPFWGGKSFDNAAGYYKNKRDGGWVRSSNIDRSQRIRGSAIQLLLPSHTSRSIVMENTKMMLYLPSPIGEVSLFHLFCHFRGGARQVLYACS